MDDMWVKNLASASLENNRLTLPMDQAMYASFIERRIQNSVQNVFDHAHRYCAAYNLHNESGQTINCLETPPEDKREAGIMLLLGRHQMRLFGHQGNLVAEGISMEGFVKKGVFRHIFSPQTDLCGSVVWSDDKKFLMDPELLVKKILETLVHWHRQADHKAFAQRSAHVKESFDEI